MKYRNTDNGIILTFVRYASNLKGAAAGDSIRRNGGMAEHTEYSKIRNILKHGKY